MKFRRDQPEPEREAARYPPYVRTPEQRRRWDLSEGIARQLFGDVDEASVWMATRSIYSGDIPTDAEPRPSTIAGRSAPDQGA